jgi:hypothetical protein
MLICFGNLHHVQARRNPHVLGEDPTYRQTNGLSGGGGVGWGEGKGGITPHSVCMCR